ncbi:probable Glutamyl-tRNA(Gln) amidotransferase subunit B, mitochondrial [Saccharomycodes ludwigii]|uniref:Glutamyl-tRNA(Gln) amidotransferase subunit B, mitochondrial n=1 Tax=Saccharomycodes ludwigii TaxID=36035 RepID=A0A376B6Z2_9ASCO|nr:hypothetical protein SCDLUD_000163 [Saccharomycodes ludwigii]KAH3902583.1 hypothetical protein SCDLUD_000163 [Saccharomycodes ludwigii]SSD60465.1 probable Glutamyl-tRNA(Gln) amidotransferase subunit B, mitochondrial [Saccharomycodes ludwigii]
MLRFQRFYASGWSKTAISAKTSANTYNDLIVTKSHNKFKLFPKYKLKCGLEIHTQLNTDKKLFSLSTNDPFQSINKPNNHVSYFDSALPGTQPVLNTQVILYALKLAYALKSDINHESTFDRKHYFYGDQPLGYQITQHYSPFAKNGCMVLRRTIDGINEEEHKINIIQLQIEQDTGKSNYLEQQSYNDDIQSLSLIDLNRSNVPLIEMVTAPEFTDLKQIRSFIKKYQNLIRHLKISTGDLETGAMRVDVNISINNYPRIELKNLPNTSSIINAIQYEYSRQVNIIENGDAFTELASSETRGWNGMQTVKLRSKETIIDYRYLPDSELPVLRLDPLIMDDLSKIIPELPDEILEKLMNEPYNLALKDAKILTTNSNGHDEMYTHEQLLTYYLATFDKYREMLLQKNNKKKVDYKLPTNWILHDFLGNLNKLQLKLEDCNFTSTKFAEFLTLIHNESLSKKSGKLLLFYCMENNLKDPNFQKLIKDFDLSPISEIDEAELDSLCKTILSEVDDAELVKNIVSGKRKNGLKFLVGQGMRLSQGRIKPQLFENTFKRILNVKW